MLRFFATTLAWFDLDITLVFALDFTFADRLTTVGFLLAAAFFLPVTLVVVMGVQSVPAKALVVGHWIARAACAGDNGSLAALVSAVLGRGMIIEGCLQRGEREGATLPPPKTCTALGHISIIVFCCCCLPT